MSYLFFFMGLFLTVGAILYLQQSVRKGYISHLLSIIPSKEQEQSVSPFGKR